MIWDDPTLTSYYMSHEFISEERFIQKYSISEWQFNCFFVLLWPMHDWTNANSSLLVTQDPNMGIFSWKKKFSFQWYATIHEQKNEIYPWLCPVEWKLLLIWSLKSITSILKNFLKNGCLIANLCICLLCSSVCQFAGSVFCHVYPKLFSII